MFSLCCLCSEFSTKNNNNERRLKCLLFAWNRFISQLSSWNINSNIFVPFAQSFFMQYKQKRFDNNSVSEFESSLQTKRMRIWHIVKRITLLIQIINQKSNVNLSLKNYTLNSKFFLCYSRSMCINDKCHFGRMISYLMGWLKLEQKRKTPKKLLHKMAIATKYENILTILTSI